MVNHHEARDPFCLLSRRMPGARESPRAPLGPFDGNSAAVRWPSATAVDRQIPAAPSFIAPPPPP